MKGTGSTGKLLDFIGFRPDHSLFPILQRMKYFAHLNTAVQVLNRYKGQQPFGIYLKEFFKQDKKYGSKDRKSISHLCYCYFRTGKALFPLTMEERVVAGLFLCSATPNEVLDQLKPEWNKQTGVNVADKCSLVNEQYATLNGQCSPLNIFPWKEELSEGIDHAGFATSFLVQPWLFLRVRPGNDDMVQQKLEASDIPFTQLGYHCLALPNASKVDEVIIINKEAVVQDYSSQRIREFLEPVAPTGGSHQQSASGNIKPGIRVWDCCAASGGKSILAHDVLGNIDLTVSDVREPIIANLRKRFAEAGIKQYHSFIADLTVPQSILRLAQAPQLIIADVPCSGSGTWGRTPEQLYYFDTDTISRYSDLQKKIVGRVIPQLAPGGYFLYITCSVFREENEAAVDYITQQSGLKLVMSEVLKGYDKQADTMFAALFEKV
jgi:16S rRNA (cytosine967-C5)-methyltransferase